MAIRILALAAMLFAANANATINAKSDEYCLALTAFTEAKSEGEHGMALVAHTVLNRAASRDKTICQIARQPNQYHGVLHWPRGKSPASVSPILWDKALQVAKKVMQGTWDFGKCRGAEFFYAPKLVRRIPAFARSHPFKCQYQGHRFYAGE